MEKESQDTSHKGQYLKKYSRKFKLDAISFAAIHGNHATEKKYNVDRKRTREWREKKESIEKTVKSKKAKGCQRKRVEEVKESLLVTNCIKLFLNGYMKYAVKVFKYNEYEL